jgi:hypothetical protein
MEHLRESSIIDETKIDYAGERAALKGKSENKPLADSLSAKDQKNGPSGEGPICLGSLVV